MDIRNDVVDGKLIVTGKGGGDNRMPWVTLVFNIAKDDLIDLEYYFNEEEAIRGHEDTVIYFERS